MKGSVRKSAAAIILLPFLGVGTSLLAQRQTQLQANPVPLINQPLVPDSATPGGSGFTLTVNGTEFVSGSVVNWNGVALATTFVSSSQLTASVPASDIATTGTASVSVFNPSPSGGPSNIIPFPVNTAAFFMLNAVTGNSIGSVPQKVATGDFNADNQPDLAVANHDSQSVSVLLACCFPGPAFTRVDYAVGNHPIGVAVGDFNHDGILDLVVSNSSDNTVSVLLGNGDGTFQSHLDYATGIGPGSVVVGDFNGDGNLDVAVANNSDNGISVLLGNGDGTFQPHVDYSTGSGPAGIVIGDFNRDGNLDMALANSGSNSVSILLGNGDGTFQAKVDYPTGQNPQSISTGDVNGDGNLDLAVACESSNSISILLGNGDGTLQGHMDYGTGNGPVSVALADLNGDQNLDLAVTNLNDSTVSILLGNGDGSFQKNMDLFKGALSSPVSLAIADFSQDGQLDLAVSNSGNGSYSILFALQTTSFSPNGLIFGNQIVGSRSQAQKMKLINDGNVTLLISNIGITGADPGDFPWKTDCGNSLAPGASCTIGVAFAPAQVGPRSASVTVTDSAIGSPQSAPLNGIGVVQGPNATFSPTSLTFATQLLNTTSPSQPTVLANWGTEALHITAAGISGDFGQTDSCRSNLPPGFSCTINVTFTPTQRGARNGTLSVTDNAPNSPQTVTLAGTGTVVSLVPPTLDFGSVQVGQSSQPQNITLTDVGSGGLLITNIGFTGADPGDFSQTNDCDGGVGAGKSCTITVTFTPTQVGARTADVSVSDNGGGSPQQVSLSGIGLSKCSGSCFRGCSRGCRCFGGRCIAQATADLLKELFPEANQPFSVACGK